MVTHRAAFIRLWQACVMALSLVAAFLVRFDFTFPQSEMGHIVFGLAILLIAKMSIFYIVGIEHGWWRFSRAFRPGEAIHCQRHRFGSVHRRHRGAHRAEVSAIGLSDRFPLCFLATAGARFSVRLYHEMVMHEVASKVTQKGLVIYGAGVAGLNLVREIRSNPRLNYRLLGFLDDNPHKWNATLLGVRCWVRARPGADRRAIQAPLDQHRRDRDRHAFCFGTTDGTGVCELPGERRAMQNHSKSCRTVGREGKSQPNPRNIGGKFAGPRTSRSGARPDTRLRGRPIGDGDWCGRVDRLGALPATGALRSEVSGVTRSGGKRPLQDSNGAPGHVARDRRFAR